MPIYLNHSSPHQEQNSSDETVIGKKDTETVQSSLADIAVGHKMSTSGNILGCFTSPAAPIGCLLGSQQGRAAGDPCKIPCGRCHQHQSHQPVGTGANLLQLTPTSQGCPSPLRETSPAHAGLHYQRHYWDHSGRRLGRGGGFKNSPKAVFLKFYQASFILGCLLRPPFSKKSSRSHSQCTQLMEFLILLINTALSKINK